MNILLVTQHFRLDGGSDVMVHLTKEVLESYGHKVFIYAAVDDFSETFPSSQHFYKPSLFKIHNFLYSLEAKRKLLTFLKDKNIDLAHLHIYYGTLTSSILKVFSAYNIPVVQHLHEYRSYCSVYTSMRNGEVCDNCRVGSYLPGLFNRCNRNSIPRSLITTAEMYVSDFFGAKKIPRKFITVSDFQRKTLIEQGMPAEKLTTIYNPIDSKFYNNNLNEVENRSGIIFVGRVEIYKGIYDFLRLAQKFSHIFFTVVGTGSALKEAIDYTQQNKIFNVRFLGQLSKANTIQEIKKNKIMIVPSKWNETFGLTAAEGMSLGSVVVVSKKGGLPEVVENEVSGFVIDTENEKCLEKTVNLIENDYSLASSVSLAAVKRAKNHFSTEKYYKRLLSTYLSALNE